MQNIDLICVGKLNAKYFAEGVAEYQKRLAAFASFRIVELPEEKIEEKNASDAVVKKALDKEGKAILSSAFFTTASEAFFSSIFSSGSSMMRKDAKAARRFWYSATPSAKYFAFSLPTQIRSMFCIAVSSFI